MNTIKQIFSDLFGLSPKNDIPLLPKVCFHKEAAYHGDHGTILVSNRSQGMTEIQVKFAFAGLATPPALDLHTVNYIWSQALEQGYIPHSILRYKNIIDPANQ